MAEFGYTVLILAFVASLFSIASSAAGARQKRTDLINAGGNSLLAVFILVTLAEVLLLIGLVTHDFSIKYVAEYTSRALPVPYLISGLWAGNAGSLLFWAWLLSLSAVVLVLRKSSTTKEIMPHASAVVMFVQMFFLIMLIFAMNPFATLPTPPADGRGLNPLLENPAMVIHPPLLLAGYVVFTIPFALAVAALMSRKLGDEWINRARGWAVLAWLLLGIGNIIGAWWAYVELGWGGYWAWDPVENAGLMPWLVGTAFLHSITMQKRRGMFKRWSMVLVILSFTLTIFGTFLTRSNLLQSVHTFGENTLVPFFLALLLISFFGSLALLIYREKELESKESTESLLSKEGAFLLNNLLLLLSTLVIFIGTLFPAIAEALSGAKVEVGKSFFNMANLPIFMAIIVLAGVCVITGWRQLILKDFKRSVIVPAIVTLIIIIALPVAGIREWSSVVSFAVSGFVITATVYQWLKELLARRRAAADNPQSRTSLGFMWLNKNRYGAYLVHISIVLIAIGVIGSSVYSVEKEAVLSQGESISLNQYTVTYDKLNLAGSETRMIITADMSVYEGNKLIAKLTPEKYIDANFEQPVTEVAIRSTPAEDIYIALDNWDSTRKASFRVLVNPLVMWIWIGGGVFFIGGLICFWPQRARLEEPQAGKSKRRPQETRTPGKPE